MQASEHLNSLAALWDLPLASTYSSSLMAGIGGPSSLADAIRGIIEASEEAQNQAQGSGSETSSDSNFKANGDDELLVAAAIAAVSLADMHCRMLLPRIIKRREEAVFWEDRASRPVRLGIETISLPLGPASASQWPQVRCASACPGILFVTWSMQNGQFHGTSV